MPSLEIAVVAVVAVVVRCSSQSNHPKWNRKSLLVYWAYAVFQAVLRNQTIVTTNSISVNTRICTCHRLWLLLLLLLLWLFGVRHYICCWRRCRRPCRHHRMQGNAKSSKVELLLVYWAYAVSYAVFLFFLDRKFSKVGNRWALEHLGDHSPAVTPIRIFRRYIQPYFYEPWLKMNAF